MGGIIEDKIFEVLRGYRFTVAEVREGLKMLQPPYEREHETVYHHMSKMFRLRQLDREKNSKGRDVYFNPAMTKS